VHRRRAQRYNILAQTGLKKCRLAVEDVPQVKMKTGKYDYNPRVWVLIPIEVKAREYHAKLLLSSIAAEAGFGVILGRKGILEFNIRFLPRGIIFGNNIVSDKEALFARYRKMGYTVAAWCEEGIAYRNRESYRHERVSAGAMRQTEAFFAWGDYHAEDVRLAVEGADHSKIVTSGSPRLDLLRPEFREFYRAEANRIRSRYGRIVLVNTNFHRFNHFLGRGAYLSELKRQGKVHDAEREAFFSQWIEFLGDMYAAFAKMLRPLSSALRSHTVVLRPHPSENHDAWRKEVEGLPNVTVVHEGSSLPWILASDVVVHNSCATGIEAFAMGVPVVTYRPLTSRTYDAFLPNAVSRQAQTQQELVALVTALATGEIPHEDGAIGEKHGLALRFFSGLEGPLASDRITEILGQLEVRAGPFASNRIHAIAREMAVRSILPTRAFLMRMVRGPHPKSDYYDQKFPSLSFSEVQNDLGRLRKISGRFAGVNVSQIGDTLFCLTSSNMSGQPND
jgi:surface carbohydrate biosynthesis protein